MLTLKLGQPGVVPLLTNRDLTITRVLAEPLKVEVHVDDEVQPHSERLKQLHEELELPLPTENELMLALAVPFHFQLDVDPLPPLPLPLLEPFRAVRRPLRNSTKEKKKRKQKKRKKRKRKKRKKRRKKRKKRKKRTRMKATNQGSHFSR